MARAYVSGRIRVVTDGSPADDADDSPVLDLDAVAGERLVELAEADGVSPASPAGRGPHVPVRPRTVVGVLGALDVPLHTEADVEAALAAVRVRPWRRLLPPVVVLREGDEAAAVRLHAPMDGAVELAIELE